MQEPDLSRQPRLFSLLRAGLAVALIGLGALAVFGPAGLIAWREKMDRLAGHEQRIAELERREAELANRVQLLDPNAVDPDLASELVRRDLQVAHPDEYVVELEN